MADLTKKQFKDRVKNEVSFYDGNGRDRSANFLVWFLKNYFRLDEDYILDIVCDHSNDKGIDGIYVDDEINEIFLFQSKYRKNFSKGEGDGDLRKFVGSGKWLTAENVQKLANSRASRELKDLVSRYDVFDKLSEGYSVKSVFVTTGTFDSSARDYIKATNDKVNYWDSDGLFANYTFTGKDEFVIDKFTFELDSDAIGYEYERDSGAYIFTIRAVDLLKLNGIVDRSLFAKNVRYGLGRTNVNKEITKTIGDNRQHRKFLLFHNGITLIAEKAEYKQTKKKLSIENYSIVNGCQSTLSLYENRDNLTNDLRLVMKVIETGKNTKLGETITYYTNNQNSIKASDLRSRDKFQMDLQHKFDEEYGKVAFYKVKEGEEMGGYDNVIENTFAAQLIYSFVLENPHDAHLKTKIFTKHYHEVFSRHTNEHLIFFLFELYNLIEENIGNVKEPVIRTYKPTRFLLLYLIKRIMIEDEVGKKFFESPKNFLNNYDETIPDAFSKLIRILIIELNQNIIDLREEDEYIDYKNLLRNAERVKRLANKINSGYERMLVHHEEDKLASLLQTKA